MPAEEAIRKYHLTDAELCQFTSDLISDMTRDTTEFANFGVDAADITALQAMGNNFEVFPSDEMYEGELVIATSAKDEKKEAVKESVRNMAIRVGIKWGENSGQYKRLGIKGMNAMNDDKLLFSARRVHTVMTEYLADLAGEGLTQVMLDDFETLCEEFEVAKNSQHDKRNIRDVKRVERVRNGNELYELVAKYCDIGKRIWFKVDPAKYDDYVIYPSGSGGGSSTLPGVPSGLNYTSGTGAFSWDAVTGATSYQLSYRATGGTEWQVGYAGPDTSVVFDPGAGGWEFRVRARNANGYGDWSAEISVVISETLDIPQNFTVEYQLDGSVHRLVFNWDYVTGATLYRIYMSMVEIGEPAGTYILAGIPSTSPWTLPPTPSKRYYFYIKASDGTIDSDASPVEMVDTPVW